MVQHYMQLLAINDLSMRPVHSVIVDEAAAATEMSLTLLLCLQVRHASTYLLMTEKSENVNELV